MHLIHEVHKVFRCTISGRRRIISNGLISPGRVKGMFHHRHQFYMGISHPFHIGNDFRRQFTVVQVRQFFLHFLRIRLVCLPLFQNSFFLSDNPLERTKVQFINTDGRVFFLSLAPLCHPFVVLPYKTGNIRSDGSRSRTQLCPKSIGI